MSFRTPFFCRTTGREKSGLASAVPAAGGLAVKARVLIQIYSSIVSKNAPRRQPFLLFLSEGTHELLKTGSLRSKAGVVSCATPRPAARHKNDIAIFRERTP